MSDNTSSADKSVQDIVRVFTEDLAQLRELHGRPSFERMHNTIRHVPGVAGSKNTFHRMVSNPGQIYGPEFVRGFVLALGLDEKTATDWEQRRLRALQRCQLIQDSAAPPGHQNCSAEPEQQPRRRSAPIALIAASAVVLAVILVLISTMGKGHSSETRVRLPVASKSSSSIGDRAPPRDGADPEDSGCSLDPEVATLDSAEVDYNGMPAGLAELIYSPLCGVAWPRFQPFPVARIPAGAVIHVYAIRPASRNLHVAFQAPYVGAVVYGNVLRNTEYCVYAEAEIEVHGKELPPSRTRCFRGKTPVQ